MRTNVPHIFAIGDVVGQPMLAHKAVHEAHVAAARSHRFMSDPDRPMAMGDAMNSGLSVGVPGLIRVMELAHRQQGRLPWARLFEPTIRLARAGFAVSDRLHKLIASDPFLENDPAARAYFFDSEGKPLAVGVLLRNPMLADVLERVARQGADAFYRGRDCARDRFSRDAPSPAWRHDRAGFAVLPRQAASGAMWPLSSLQDLRDAAPLLGRYRHTGLARHARAFPNASDGSQFGRGGALFFRGRAVGLCRPRSLRGRS